ncbi:MAG TPA: glycosyltransferase family 2 protein [Phnomibacter sp.]|nr:glycosyltransferase family 2 protein [Phnomibacter sp.]
MKVSIITTSYNSGHTIKDTLMSVATQDYPDIEHLIIDGGSTDETLEVVSRFSHNSLVVSEKDGGIFHAMNKGLRLCTGDVICFLNSDDWYHTNDVISKVVRNLTYSNCKVVYGDLQYVKQYNPERIVRTWKSGQFRRKNLYYGWMPPHPAFFAKKEVYEEVGFFNTDLNSAADYELMLRILLKHEHDACYIPEVLVKMRQGGYSNASFKNRLKANHEDHQAWVLNGLKPLIFTRYLKPIRKIPQFFLR